MSADALPISPTAFASALTSLPLTTLHLKAAELRNSIAHLDYSNEQLRPFASSSPTSNDAPDAVCVEAIQENEVVIRRMEQRLQLLKSEVESRGASWLEFMSTEEVVRALGEGRGLESAGVAGAQDEPPVDNISQNGQPAVNGATSNPWTDGTFQTGRISGGEVMLDGVNGGETEDAETEVIGISGHAETSTSRQGGSIGDNEMRRRMEERLREARNADDDDDGMHL